MSYNRKIFYISLYEDNEKKSNAGYIKVLENGDVQEVEVKISGISAVFDGEQEMVISVGNAEIGKEKIVLKNGQGQRKCGWKKSAELARLSFCIQLSAACCLEAGEKMTEKIIQEVPVQVIEDVKQILMSEEEVEQVAEGEEMLPQLEASEEKEVPDQEKNLPERATRDKVENRKWKQICKAYPHIKPFGDFREYVKLDLKDMVLISEKKYSLVENSFLLHGYYNYDHIILWRKEKTPMKYYIGVPGNFYEKEKQVAVLYGFESFEGEVEPAKEGDFGYYMTEVSI